MKPQEWRQKLGDCVRYLFLSPEMEAFLLYPVDAATGADLSFCNLVSTCASAAIFGRRWRRTVRSSRSSSASWRMNMKS